MTKPSPKHLTNRDAGALLEHLIDRLGHELTADSDGGETALTQDAELLGHQQGVAAAIAALGPRTIDVGDLVELVELYPVVMLRLLLEDGPERPADWRDVWQPVLQELRRQTAARERLNA
jgi:malonyl CoA-acyl carrier protein transacylase